MSEIEPTIQQPPPVAEARISQQRSPVFWILGSMGGCFVLLSIAILLPVILGINTLSGIGENLGRLFHIPTPIIEVTPSRTLITSLQPLGQLVSISTQLAKADITVNVRQGALNACAFSANHVAVGAVDAGIDLSKVTQDDILYDADAKKYTITLPAPELTSCRIDYIRQYEGSLIAPPCTADWDGARLIASHRAILDFRQDAVEGGILDRAEQQAGLVVGNFVQALNPDDEVEVIFRESQASPDGNASYPSSCEPPLLPGWVFNEATGSWQPQS
jgi:hypothetical protein